MLKGVEGEFVDGQKIVLQTSQVQTPGLAQVRDHQQALNQFLGEVDRDVVRASVAETNGVIVPRFFVGVYGLSFL